MLSVLVLYVLFWSCVCVLISRVLSSVVCPDDCEVFEGNLKTLSNFMWHVCCGNRCNLSIVQFCSKVISLLIIIKVK